MAFAAVILVLAGIEVGLRVTERRLAIDVQHIQEIPRVMERLAREPSPRILFLGNSLTRAGIVPGAFSEALSARAARVYPDDTTLADWYYVYRKFIEGTRPHPDLLVVSFALSQLDDNQVLHVDRLGSHFAGFGHIGEAFRRDVLSLGDRVDFLLAAAFRSMAHHERVRSRVLAAIPGYKQLAQTINESEKKKVHEPERTSTATFRRLERFLELTRGHGDKVVFVASPLTDVYEVPDRLRQTIRDGGGHLIDMQGVEQFTEDDFADGYHLSPAGAARYSAALARVMKGDGFVRSALNR